MEVIEYESLSRLHILFIDNDPLAHSRFLQTLRDGFVVWSASSITEAKEYLASAQPDMVVTEAYFNDHESGLELCCYIRGIPSLRHLPIMLLTSRATLADKIAGFEVGADDYVVKPFDGRHLIARIRLLARIKRLEQKTQ